MHLIFQITIPVAYTLLFIFIIYKLPFFKLPHIKPKYIALVFILKILAGTAMYFIYSFYYDDRSMADIFKYFDDSKIMYDALFDKPMDYFKMLFSINNDNTYFAEKYYMEMNNWFRVYESNIYNDSHTIIRFNALIRLFSFGIYHVHTVFMCFLALTGLLALYKFFIHEIRENHLILFMGIMFIPSVLFWGSGVLKEGILLFALGMWLYYISKLIRGKRSILILFWVLFPILLLFFTKFYILISILPLIIAYTWVKLSKTRFVFLKYSIVSLVYFLIGLNIHHVFPSYNFVHILVLKQRDFLNLAQSVDSGSLIQMQVLQYNLGSILSNAPLAFLRTLFRPWFFEIGSIFTFMAGLENLLILFLIFVTLIFKKKKIPSHNLLFLSLFFVLFVFTLTGLTTPVTGAMVRYKIPALPFLFVIFSIIVDANKLKSIKEKISRWKWRRK